MGEGEVERGGEEEGGREAAREEFLGEKVSRGGGRKAKSPALGAGLFVD